MIANPPGRLAGLQSWRRKDFRFFVVFLFRKLFLLLSGNVFYQLLGCTVFEYYFVFLVQ